MLLLVILLVKISRSVFVCDILCDSLLTRSDACDAQVPGNANNFGTGEGDAPFINDNAGTRHINASTVAAERRSPL